MTRTIVMIARYTSFWRPLTLHWPTREDLSEGFHACDRVTNVALPSRSVVRFYNKRSTAEQWIKEGKQATHWAWLSCHRFRANEVRLQLSVLALPKSPLRSPERHDRADSKAGAAAKEVPNVAVVRKLVASRPWIGYHISARTAKKEILVYNKRGTAEQWIKEGKQATGSDGPHAEEERASR